MGSRYRKLDNHKEKGQCVVITLYKVCQLTVHNENVCMGKSKCKVEKMFWITR